MERHVIVTGGAGYVGSHACKALARAGFVPVVLDNLCNGHAFSVKWGPLVRGNIEDRDLLDVVFDKYRPVAVMHFAAYAYVGESVTDPGKYYKNNVAGTLLLLMAMKEHQIKNLIFSSTCSTYGSPQELPITEEHGQMPINPYGMSKLMVERILCDFGRAYGLKSVILRYFNAAGADHECETGECHAPETHLIPLVLNVALGQSPFVKIYGTDYDTHDGTCVRDYVHVSDLADAHVLALEHLLSGGPGGAFNLGNSSGFSVRDVIDAASRVTGSLIQSVEIDRRAGDPAVLIGSSEKAKKVLGWKPMYSNIDEIIITAWCWALKKTQLNELTNGPV